jgi:DNA polymerase III alpha subunit
MPDIDIDFIDREEALSHFKHIRARREENGKAMKHNTGVYMHEVPYDPINNLSSIIYDKAEEQGLFKLDFLNVSLYKGIKNEQHLTQLMDKEPLWELLEQDDFTDMLFHVNGHGQILRRLKPTNIPQLAAVLAMIRPAKRHLIDQDWQDIMTEVWKKPEGDEYFFKKSHATAYAVAVVVQMNLICEQVSQQHP